MKKIGFIGAGNMAGAIIGGIIKSNLVESQNVIASAKTMTNLNKLKDEYNINVTLDAREVVKNSDIVFMAVKPNIFDGVLESVKDLIGDEKIVVSIDARNKKVATHGWEKLSDIDSVDLCKELEQIGVKTIVYTDISKDGMLKGPNFDIYKELSQKTSLDIIASGGVTSIDDIKKLRDMNMYGAIIGKALYDKKLDLKEVIDLC